MDADRLSPREERRTEEWEYREWLDREQWREHFDRCGHRDPCPHAG